LPLCRPETDARSVPNGIPPRLTKSGDKDRPEPDKRTDAADACVRIVFRRRPCTGADSARHGSSDHAKQIPRSGNGHIGPLLKGDEDQIIRLGNRKQRPISLLFKAKALSKTDTNPEPQDDFP